MVSHARRGTSTRHDTAPPPSSVWQSAVSCCRTLGRIFVSDLNHEWIADPGKACRASNPRPLGGTFRVGTRLSLTAHNRGTLCRPFQSGAPFEATRDYGIIFSASGSSMAAGRPNTAPARNGQPALSMGLTSMAVLHGRPAPWWNVRRTCYGVVIRPHAQLSWLSKTRRSC